MVNWRKECTLDVYKLVVGAFVFVSPWLFAFSYSPARLDAWGTGLIVMALSAAAMVIFVDLEEWLALAVGLWMLAAPWVLGLPPAATKIHIAAGLICVYLAGLELWLVHYHRWERPEPSNKSR